MRHQEVILRSHRTWCHSLVAGVVALIGCLVSTTSCSEWNTDSLGQSFQPSNSVVRSFTHAAYLEYGPNSARLWGPAADEVTATIDGACVTLSNQSDSLALIVYGYQVPNPHVNANPEVEASLVIQSSRPYALYLSGFSLRPLQPGQPAIQSQGGGTLHVVLVQGTDNKLYAPLQTDGAMTLSGSGTLNIQSLGTCISATSIQCQHAVNVTLTSSEGHGIEALDGSMRSTTGKWRIHAAQSGINATDSILLFAGDYQGTSLDGPFLQCRRGAIVRRPTLIAASGRMSAVIDSTRAAEHYDSIQSLWQQRVDTLQLFADSLCLIRRNSNNAVAARFTPRQSLQQPYFLISNGTILSSDTLHFSYQ